MRRVEAAEWLGRAVIHHLTIFFVGSGEPVRRRESEGKFYLRQSVAELSLMMRGLRQISISPTRKLAVLVEVNAAILSEYEAEKGESSFFLGI